MKNSAREARVPPPLVMYKKSERFHSIFYDRIVFERCMPGVTIVMDYWDSKSSWMCTYTSPLN